MQTSSKVKVWTRDDGWLSTNAPIIAGKKWGVPPVLAALMLVQECRETLKEAGVEEVTFTLSGHKIPVWTILL